MDPTDGFFHSLRRRGHEPRLERTSGSVRIEVAGGGQTQRWLVAIDGGDVSVSRRSGPADAVLGADRALFNRLVTGEANAMASALRGLLHLDGDPELLVLFQRLLGVQG